MTGKEIKVFIERIGFAASEINYYNEKNKVQEWDRANARYDALNCLADSLKAGIKTVRTELGTPAVVFGEIGKNKMYFSWCTSCSVMQDEETWAETQKVIKEYKNSGYACYMTDGKHGMERV